MLSSLRSFRAAIIILAMIMFAGCGKKAPLVPPQKLVPVAIGDLRYMLDESGVTLNWTYPTKMENGAELEKVESFEVARAEIYAEEYCEGCPIRFDRLTEIDGNILPASGGSMIGAYSETDLQEGYRYFYKVRSRAGWWYPSSDSNMVSFVWRSPPKAPEGLQIEYGEMKLTLAWQAVEENIAGNPLGATPVYQVYRKKGNGRFAAVGEPVQGLQYIDADLENDMVYTYRLRAIVKYADSLQAGSFSREKTGVPRDIMPPAQPENLVAVRVAAGVKLVWQAVASEDLAGYRIYRREGGASEPRLLAEVAFDKNQYVDPDLRGGRKWFYSVSSFDRQQPPNESPPSVEAGVEY